MIWLRSLWEKLMILIERQHVPDNELFKAPNRDVKRVFIHCSASDNPDYDVVAIKRDHTSPDPKDPSKPWKDIGYHYVIKFDGTIQIGRSLELAPAAQAPHNSHTIAICLQGGQNEKPNAFTEAQFDSLRALSRAIARELPNVTFHGHREVANKACPVFDYQQVLSLDAKGHLTI